MRFKFKLIVGLVAVVVQWTTLAVLAAQTAPLLTSTQVATMEAALTSYFNLTASYGVRCNPCNVGDNIGALVRLVFHDAFGGGGPTGAGGMNGCIDFNEPDNNGLQEVVGQLNTV